MVASKAKALGKLVALCLTAGVVLAAILFPYVGGVGVAANRVSDTIAAVPAELVSAQMPLGSTILDRNGQPIAYLYDQDREISTPQEIPKHMRDAIVAIEDHRFYQHNGLDAQRSLKAVGGFFAGESAGGGSTLTQQYVKNYLGFVLAKDDAERKAAMAHSPARKIREAKLAVEIERQMSKDDILVRYLNLVPFGGNVYGIKAAARTYFGTTPDKLTLAQSAFLAAMVNKPTTLLKDPVEAKKRRNLVIDRMLETGFLKEGKEVADKAKNEDVGLAQPLNTRSNDCGNLDGGTTTGFFCGYVLDYLAKAGITKDQLKRGGYVIKTTMDPAATEAAKRAAENQVSKDTKGIANVMAVVEPGADKHAVRALAANRDFGVDASKGQTAYRLPSTITRFGAGSIYKIFTAAAALDRGVAGVNKSMPVPASYTSSVYKGNGNKPYTVSNDSAGGDTTMTLQGALAHSPNTAFVKLEEDAGLDKVVDMSVKLGMRESMQLVNRGGEKPDPNAKDASLRINQEQWVKDGKIGSFTLGVTVTSVLELANVGATIVSEGKWCPPSPIDQILDRDGKSVAINEPGCEQAVEPGLARSLAQAMSKDTTEGTASIPARNAGWTKQMIGKTGTTQIHQSAGFVGATPQLSGAVLVFSDGDTPKPICDGERPFLCAKGNIYGGKVPARTWFEAMKPLHKGLPDTPLPPADPKFLN
ncbi:penicillin-binding protein [Actinosynnema sp. ALI-1.44]|uniref:transglycosylase domain-containing protein n=1 Tax=Actinosynnema sp. ALI-1.44 TaxID=1933779 RepID=UPI00097C74C5|nr:transglycosylase domain-containing protein [Actinosynnema sp. ALI-1.44]ONI82869.1 penicillin-binding protein [Actinosynnema sp. ALI-1.44]